MPGHKKIQSLSPDLVIGLTLLAFGGAELWSASSLSISADFTLGPGALPVAYSSGLILFSALLIYGSLSQKGTEAAPAMLSNVRNGAIFLTMMVAFVAMIYAVGFLISSIIFSIMLTYFMCGVSKIGSVAFGLIWSIGIFLVFKYALQVPLESGWLFS